jgi:hypothetical protein
MRRSFAKFISASVESERMSAFRLGRRLLLGGASPRRSKFRAAAEATALPHRGSDEVPEWWPRGIGYLTAQEMRLIKEAWLGDAQRHTPARIQRLSVQEHSLPIAGQGISRL